jgi:hypothetical protein
MTEVVYPTPMDPHMIRMAAVAELIAYGPLLAHLDVDGLLVIRYRLREPALVATCATGNLAVMRADLLNATCRALAAAGFAPLQYFVDNGEAYPEVADTVPETFPPRPATPEEIAAIVWPTEPDRSKGEPWWPQGKPEGLE